MAASEIVAIMVNRDYLHIYGIVDGLPNKRSPWTLMFRRRLVSISAYLITITISLGTPTPSTSLQNT